MTKQKINMSYWDNLKAKPDEHDVIAINDAFTSSLFTDSQKTDLAELILASRIRIMDEERFDALNVAVGQFNQQFAVEEFFYAESNYVFFFFFYSYKDYVHAIPLKGAKAGINQIYTRLGVELDDSEIMLIYNSSNIYSAFFDLISENLGNNLYIKTDNPESWNSFVFVSYFNMWHFFGVLGFNGYSPYTIIADIGILTPPASTWKFVALTAEYFYCIEELQSRGRGRQYPTFEQNCFIGKLANI